MGGYCYALGFVPRAATGASVNPDPHAAAGDASPPAGPVEAGWCVAACGDKSLRLLALHDAAMGWTASRNVMVWQGVQGQVTAMAIMPGSASRTLLLPVGSVGACQHRRGCVWM